MNRLKQEVLRNIKIDTLGSHSILEYKDKIIIAYDYETGVFAKKVAFSKTPTIEQERIRHYCYAALQEHIDQIILQSEDIQTKKLD